MKQLLQSEREAAMRAAGAKFKERKRKEALPAKSRLVGAALQAVARREERERLAKEAARAEQGDEAGEEVKDEAKDVEMKEGDDADEKAVGEGEEQEEAKDDTPKRDIPTCKFWPFQLSSGQAVVLT